MTMPQTSDPGRRVRKRAKAECRENRHRYGSAQAIGGGILRRVCQGCGAVSIDLTAVEEPVEVGLFRDRSSALPSDGQ